MPSLGGKPFARFTNFAITASHTSICIPRWLWDGILARPCILASLRSYKTAAAFPLPGNGRYLRCSDRQTTAVRGASASITSSSIQPARRNPLEMTARFALNCAKESDGTISVPSLCIGTWAWGDSRTWKNTSPAAVQELEGAWKTIASNDLFFLDTAEVYGSGESERIIARLRTNSALTTAEFKSQLVIASKYLPIPWPPARLFPSKGMVNACRESLVRLGLESMDLYQIHGPVHFAHSIETMAGGLAKCVELGLTRAVGVSNYSKDEMVRMDEALKKQGLRLASNQVEFSLLRTLPDTSGLLAECKKRGIVLMAYSPLGMGRLTGKYNKDNPLPAGRRFGNITGEKLASLVEVMSKVAAGHGVTCSAVALKWVIQKGAIPLGGVKNAKQAEENAKAASETWALSAQEMAELDGLAQQGTTSAMWQHG